MSVTIDASGIENLDLFFDRFPQVASRAMSIAINETARGAALDLARKDITEQVAFPDGYLDDPDHLGVSQFATPTRLEAKITARQRPTSLLRFALDAPPPGARGGKDTPPIQVMVKPGQTKAIPRSFVLNLNSGNLGLAIRLRAGEMLHNRRDMTAIQIFPNVYLLYGPSVDQVFQTVALDIIPEVTADLETEFTRQFDRLLNAG